MNASRSLDTTTVRRFLSSRRPTPGHPRDWSRLIFTFGVVAYVVRVIGPGWRSGFPLFFPDSSSFVSVARLGPLHPSFWWSERPVGTPLVLWLSGGNHRVFFLVQTLLYALGVATLCSVLLKIFASRWLGWITCAAVTAVAVNPRFGMWHLEILSESLALSVSLFLIAAWLRFGITPTRRHLVVGVSLTALWMLIRDAHLAFGVLVMVVLAVWGTLARRSRLRRTALLGAGVLLACGTFIVISQGVSDRNLYPVINNVGERVLPDAELTKTFADSGMPIDDALLARAGSDSWTDNQAFLVSEDLREFRNWARDHGQQAFAKSLVVDSSYWINVTRDALGRSASLDYRDYDRFSTSERLPARLFWFEGPRSSVQFAVWGALGLLGLAELMAGKKRRLLGFVGSLGVLAMLVDLLLSASGDSVEVERHLIGPLLRLSLLLIIFASFGLQEIAARLVDPRRRRRPEEEQCRGPRRRPMSVSAALAASLTAVGLFGSWIALEHRSQDFDPQYARTIIERAAKFGGTYYQNGIHNKGPIETAVYDSARLFTSYDTYWFAISAYVLVISAVLGATAWLIARSLNATRRLAGTAAALTFLHFTLSASDYAGVLYSRNITTAILALVVAVTIWHRPWRNQRTATVTFVLVAVLLGLAVQTLLTTLFAVVVVGAFVHVRRSRSTTLAHPMRAMVAAGAGALGSAPMWYLMRGSFDEFWSNWWTYAGFMSSSTGRSLLNQFGLGAQQLFGYYQQRPGILLLVISFIALVRRGWSTTSTATRSLQVVLLAWLAAGWIELILSQRYSSHYFSVVAVPTTFIAVATAVAIVDIFSRSARSVSVQERTHASRSSMWMPIAAATLLLAIQGTQLTWIAIEGAGGFRGVEHYVEARRAQRPGNRLTRQATMDLVSVKDDPLLAWTMYPWTYLDYRRVPATRFSWKSFLIGEIYLGRTSPRYVLDRTWQRFAQDLAQSEPRIYARPLETELDPGTPFARVVSDEFTTVYVDDDLEIGWRTNMWAQTTRPVSSSELWDVTTLTLPSTWSTDRATGSIVAPPDAAPWVVPTGACSRFTARLVRTSAADPMGIAFDFTPSRTDPRPVRLSVDFDRSWSSRGGSKPEDQDSLELASTEFADASRLALPVTLLVNTTAAALIVEGRIVAAIPLDGPVSISARPLEGTLHLDELSSVRVPGLAGC